MLNEDSITELKGSLRGKLIQPGDADYDEAREVYNGMTGRFYLSRLMVISTRD